MKARPGALGALLTPTKSDGWTVYRHGKMIGIRMNESTDRQQMKEEIDQ